MDRYILYKNEVRKLLRKENDEWLTLLTERDPMGRRLIRWVPAKDCTLLDPALNILFERNEDGQERRNAERA